MKIPGVCSSYGPLRQGAPALIGRNRSSAPPTTRVDGQSGIAFVLGSPFRGATQRGERNDDGRYPDRDAAHFTNLRFSGAREAVEAEHRLYNTSAKPYDDSATRD